MSEESLGEMVSEKEQCSSNTKNATSRWQNCSCFCRQQLKITVALINLRLNLEVILFRNVIMN